MTLRRRWIVAGDIAGLAECVGDSSSSAVATPFWDTGKSERTHFAKLKASHTGARVAVEVLPFCECADLIGGGEIVTWTEIGTAKTFVRSA